MRMRSRLAWTLWLTLCLSLLVVSPAAAYLDPGSGSVIFQAVIAGAMAASVGVKVFWSRIRRLFARGERAPEDATR